MRFADVLSGLERPTAAQVFEDMIITDKVDLERRTLTPPFRFCRCEFKHGFVARYATFKATLVFEDCEFSGVFDLDSAIFEKDVWLNGTFLALAGEATTDHAADEGANIVFNDARFLGALNARGIVVEAGRVMLLDRTHFASDVYLDHAHLSAVNVRDAEFVQSLYLDDTHLGAPPRSREICDGKHPETKQTLSEFKMENAVLGRLQAQGMIVDCPFTCSRTTIKVELIRSPGQLAKDYALSDSIAQAS